MVYDRKINFSENGEKLNFGDFKFRNFFGGRDGMRRVLGGWGRGRGILMTPYTHTTTTYNSILTQLSFISLSTPYYF